MLALVVLIAVLVPSGPLALDRSWSEAMHDLETPFLTNLALVFNWLGRGIGRAVSLTLIGLILLRRRRRLALVAFAVAESLAPLLSILLKVLVDRSRPPDGLVQPVGASFPSGHATYAGATCVALVLLFTTPGARRRWWWALACLGIVGMAWSRTYLQVHWLTDVIAGALLGSGISLLVFAIAQGAGSPAVAGLTRRGSRGPSRGRRSAAPAGRRRPRPRLPRRTRVRGLNRPTSARLVGCSPAASWPTARSSPTSSASSRISSVTACRAAIVKWTSTSEPSASRSSTRPAEPRSRVAVRERRVVEILGPDSEHDLAAVVGRERRAPRERLVVQRELASRRATPPRPPSRRSIRASSMFIAGLPMKPPTNTLTGSS